MTKNIKWKGLGVLNTLPPPTQIYIKNIQEKMKGCVRAITTHSASVTDF